MIVGAALARDPAKLADRPHTLRVRFDFPPDYQGDRCSAVYTVTSDGRRAWASVDFDCSSRSFWLAAQPGDLTADGAFVDHVEDRRLLAYALTDGSVMACHEGSTHHVYPDARDVTMRTWRYLATHDLDHEFFHSRTWLMLAAVENDFLHDRDVRSVEGGPWGLAASATWGTGADELHVTLLDARRRVDPTLEPTVGWGVVTCPLVFDDGS